MNARANIIWQSDFGNDSLPNVITRYALNFEEVAGAYWFRVVRPSVRASVCPSVRQKTVHATVSKFHIWIPHGKIVDTRFFFLSELSPFLELCPFEKI